MDELRSAHATSPSSHAAGLGAMSAMGAAAAQAPPPVGTLSVTGAPDVPVGLVFRLQVSVERLRQGLARAELDAAFAGMGDDALHQEEALRLAAEFERADAEALRLGLEGEEEAPGATGP